MGNCIEFPYGTARAFARDFNWWLEGEDLHNQFDKTTGTLRCSVAAKVIEVQHGAVKQKLRSYEPARFRPIPARHETPDGMPVSKGDDGLPKQCRPPVSPFFSRSCVRWRMTIPSLVEMSSETNSIPSHGRVALVPRWRSGL